MTARPVGRPPELIGGAVRKQVWLGLRDLERLEAIQRAHGLKSLSAAVRLVIGMVRVPQ